MSEENGLSKQSFLLFGVLAIFIILAGICWAVLEKDKRSLVRSIEFTEKISVSIPNESKNVRIWIPVPANDSYQTTEILKIESPYPYHRTQDKLFQNHLIYFESKPLTKDTKFEIKVSYKIIRKEQRVLGQENSTESNTQTPSLVASYLEPRGLEVINEKIKKVSEEITKGIEDPVIKARALYTYVLEHMKYDKSGREWGRGDSVYACDIGKGNCTDFHSLFICLARASHIPARFQMGIALPQISEGEPSTLYHCWAEFYLHGEGWIPVDISEAWKNPKKADYFFGNLDADRFLLSTGREIFLAPQQNGKPLNYISKPYIELDGQPYYDFKLERRFKNI